ncbi:MAG: glucose 1-dehydrogenase [Deltaproteobacteria bacterium]|nr:glucose 1-dehydrogenase [Deltaproteobacteria bacterium]
MHVKQLFDLAGKSAIVTGGGRGIGREIAEGLVEAGARVAISGRRRKWLDPAAEELRALGGEVMAVEADVGDPDGVAQTVRAVAERFGGVDILVNNAGINWAAPSLEYPVDKWRSVLDVNLSGVWLMSQGVAQNMVARGGGSIVNVSSIAAHLGIAPELQDTVAYNAAKGGVDALTRDLAVKWARHGIRVNAIAPGYFPTRLTEYLVQTVEERMKAMSPMQRLGQPGELKGAVVFLCSPAASFVTGQVLNIDGGSTIW